MPVRLRLTLTMVLATAVLVVTAGTLGSLELRASMLGAIDEGLAGRAEPIARTLADTDAVDREDLRGRLVSPREAFAQVVHESGAVVAASAGLSGEALLTPEARAALAQHRRVTFERPVAGVVAEDDVRLLAVPVTRSDGRYVVIVGTSLEPLETALRRVVQWVVVGGAAAVLLAGLAAWLLAGAALRPVERMRTAVAATPDDGCGAAVEVPGTRDELAALGTTLNDLLDRIRQARARERRLVADASHELRTPLTVLRAELELAARPGRGRDELVEAVAQAAREADRVARLADDLLFLARADEGGPVVQTVDQPLVPTLEAAVAAARRRAGAAVECVLVADPAVSAPVDRERLRQALDNLLDNAVRVSPPGGRVELRAAPVDQTVVLEVVDAGPGFPPEFLPHAFERFRRADAARDRRAGGAGLGLAIVEAIAGGHGGRVEAVNRPDGGAVVRLILPA